ncbi:MAG: FAD-dependent oxidoreductase [Bdellovibrionales bacterium]
MKEFEYDIAIIGSGLAGCVAAQTLAKNGMMNFVVIEAHSDFGGSVRGLAKGAGFCDYGLKQIPAIAQQETQDFTQIMNQLLGIQFEEKENSLMTWSKSGDSFSFQPFVGFGEKTPPDREVLDYYLQTKLLSPSQPVHTWPASLLEGLQGKLLLRSSVTKLEVENDEIKSLIVNGDKKIRVQRVIFAGHPMALETLLPANILPGKTRQRLTKTKFWTSINLELRHTTPIAAQPGLNVLVGPGEEPRVVLGHFHELADGTQHSHWLTFAPGFEADEEETASALREMKKLILKSYPTALDSKQEKVLVTPKSHGTLGGKNESDSAMTGVKNFHLASSMLEPVPNMIGAVTRAHTVTLATLRELKRSSPHQADLSI